MEDEASLHQPIPLVVSSPSMVDEPDDTKLRLGICAMDKKSRSKPMRAILSRLNENIFDVIVFGDEVILEQPIEEWPRVDALVAFFSKGFPLDKAIAYYEMFRPYCLNDLYAQRTLQDRRNVYRILEENGINVPVHAIADRDTPEAARDLWIEEFDEYIEVNGVQLQKPVVEKPVNAEDHNIRIYYPVSKGGGCKKLFRKIGDRSSDFSPDISDLRKEGSYIYEEFLETQGTDVKVYTVGPDYGHAEARKSPALDGVVNRDESGKEVRFPVLLTPGEKAFARRIVLAFGQTVCGFDILRTQDGRSYVCDVNGWSFVKGSRKYYDDCAQLLSEFVIAKAQPARMCSLSAIGPMVHRNRSHANLSPPATPLAQRRPGGYPHPDPPGGYPGTPTPGGYPPSDASSEAGDAAPASLLARLESQDGDLAARRRDARRKGGSVTEELRCVVSVIRHADRSPKQKMKMAVGYPEYLAFFQKHSAPREELKVKGKALLREFLEVTKRLIERLEAGAGAEGDEGARSSKNMHKLVQIRSVLGRFRIAGINRKVQLKPSAWEGGRATTLLLILKWGGDLTDVGIEQATTLGQDFRHRMYPDPENGGILRLHSTFRHDMKIKSSDEGRCMKTAAAFAQGMLELEGDLTPILASLVKVDNHKMLDPSGNKDIKDLMEDCKRFVDRCMQADVDLSDALIEAMVPSRQSSIVRALKQIGNPRRSLARIYSLIASIVLQLEDKVSEMDNPDQPSLNGKETPRMMLERWRKLHKDFYDEETHTYDLSKVPDVHDAIRFDAIHNRKARLRNMDELLDLAKHFADSIVPQEYGIDAHTKRIIGAKTCQSLLDKIKRDLVIAASDDDVDMRYNLDLSHAADLPINSLGRRVRSRLYFTSESHLHTLLNVLRYAPVYTSLPVEGGDGPLLGSGARALLGSTTELCYLTQISFRLFEQVTNVLPEESGPQQQLVLPTRQFRVEVQFSPGVVDNEQPQRPEHLLKLNRHISLQRMVGYLDAAVSDGGSDTALAKGHIFEVEKKVAEVLQGAGCRIPSPPPAVLRPSNTRQQHPQRVEEEDAHTEAGSDQGEGEGEDPGLHDRPTMTEAIGDMAEILSPSVVAAAAAAALLLAAFGVRRWRSLG